MIGGASAPGTRLSITTFSQCRPHFQVLRICGFRQGHPACEEERSHSAAPIRAAVCQEQLSRERGLCQCGRPRRSREHGAAVEFLDSLDPMFAVGTDLPSKRMCGINSEMRY